MTARLRLLHPALILVASLLALGAVRELLASRPLPPPPAPRAARPAAAIAPSPEPPLPGGYGVIAAKNLFSPTRTEGPPPAVAAAGPKPTLHGVVMDGARSRAYLEDPAQKRTFGYVVGDPIGGGHVESIAADRVVIGRGGDAVEVLLRDPAKPRPAGPPAPDPPPAAGAPASDAAPPAGRAGAVAPAAAARTDR